MNMQPWNLVFVIGFIIYAAIRGVFEQCTKGNETAVSHGGTQERLLIGVLFVGTFLLPVLYLFTSLLAFADYALPRWAPWAGTVLMASALWLFWRSHADLGANWSITLEVRKGHELIKHGVYRRIRHPMYAAIFLFSIAQGLLLQSWLAGWAGLVTVAPLYLVRTPREEKMMCEFFGESYRDYMGRTGRLWPRL